MTTLWGVSIIDLIRVYYGHSIGPRDLVFLKLYAAADDVGPTSRHFKDLLALEPRPADLEAARAWVATQDPSPTVAQAVAQVIAHVRQAGR